jgi:hypothetical protein
MRSLMTVAVALMVLRMYVDLVNVFYEVLRVQQVAVHATVHIQQCAWSTHALASHTCMHMHTLHSAEYTSTQ